VKLPLCQTKFDPAGTIQGLLITFEQHSESICSHYTAGLKQIYATIPKIDKSQNILGEMSNNPPDRRRLRTGRSLSDASFLEFRPGRRWLASEKELRPLSGRGGKWQLLAGVKGENAGSSVRFEENEVDRLRIDLLAGDGGPATLAAVRVTGLIRLCCGRSNRTGMHGTSGFRSLIARTRRAHPDIFAKCLR
jgi:hypothetical protein